MRVLDKSGNEWKSGMVGACFLGRWDVTKGLLWSGKGRWKMFR